MPPPWEAAGALSSKHTHALGFLQAGNCERRMSRGRVETHKHIHEPGEKGWKQSGMRWTSVNSKANSQPHWVMEYKASGKRAVLAGDKCII